MNVKKVISVSVMALNKYMHPRNVYKNRKPDFNALSVKFDYFREKVTVNDSGKVILDFKDPSALRALTQALLEADFGLVVTMPLDRLIPTVPQRLNYILWLEDIVGKENGAKGIDIGTGASCIYPLLGCRVNQWRFVASEIDDQNIYFANKNIASNKMEENIKVKKVTDDILLIGLIDEEDTYDFCMCNPPFYSDHLEAQGITSSRNDNRSESSSVSTASEAESIAWGGEVRFVTQMIDESLVLKTKVRVYTSLLGKKNSLAMLKDVLQQKQVPKFGSTEFCQGRTMRWGIAWTFDPTVEFPKSSFKEQKNVKPPLTLEIPRSSASLVGDYTVQAYTWFIIRQLEELKIHFFTKHSGKFYTCFIIQAKENTWSHQRQKRRRENRQKPEVADQHQTVQTAETDRKTCISGQTGSSGSTEVITVTGSEDPAACKGNVDNMDATAIKRPAEGNLIETETETKRLKCSAECITSLDVEKDMDSGKAETNQCSDNIESCQVEQSESKDKVKNYEFLQNESKIECGNSVVRQTDGDLQPQITADKSGQTCEDQEMDCSNKLVRKDVIERFWKEQAANTEENKKKKEKSFYEVLEPFPENEQCLLLSKMVVRKDEGIIFFSLAHLAGNREAMHQILQYFKNKWTVK